MFTGIIEEVGEVREVTPRQTGARITIGCHTVLADACEGSSIAVNGVCLTARALTPGAFSADLAPETLSRTNLGALRPGARVNLERPLAAGGRLSGHIVQGHVDGTGTFRELRELGDGNWWLEIRVPATLTRYLVEKGSIAIDGISVTVAKLDADLLSVAIIPHTYANTTLGGYGAGDAVNLEVDILAKHVEKLLEFSQAK